MAAAAPSSDEASADERPTRSRASLLLEKIFRSCDEDPKGSVHKAWGLSLIFVFVYFIISVVESKFSHCPTYLTLTMISIHSRFVSSFTLLT